jgi:hypothetical protein
LRAGALAPALAVLLAAGAGRGAERKPVAYFTLAVGYNGAPAGAAGEGLEPLKFADDDAAAIYRLARELGHAAILLAALDVDTRRRAPELVTEARPPSLVELGEAVNELNTAMAAAERGGAETSLMLFFSGHGLRAGAEGAGLALSDGRLTHERLYQEVLGKLRAGVVHLVVDACHAEAVVRPRDLRAQSVPTPPEDLGAYVQKSTLARFPRVGAVIASSFSEQAQEWDAFRSGVFTHEVLSALRGGADIDGDRRIEYSELAAFLGAANRSVLDPRARPTTVIRAPERSPRAVLVELVRSERTGALAGRPADLGPLYVEDARGNRLASINAEPGHRVELLLPAAVDLFVRAKHSDAETVLAPRAVRDFRELAFRPLQSRARGPVEQSLRQGLFATRYGPSYYSGFVDRNEDLVPVAIPALVADGAAEKPRARTGAWVAWGAALPLAAAGGILGGLALDARGDARSALYERPTSQAHDRSVLYGSLAVGTLAIAAVSGAVGYWLWQR